MCDPYFWLSKNSNKSKLDQFYQTHACIQHLQSTLCNGIQHFNMLKFDNKFQLPDNSLGNLDLI